MLIFVFTLHYNSSKSKQKRTFRPGINLDMFKDHILIKENDHTKDRNVVPNGDTDLLTVATAHMSPPGCAGMSQYLLLLRCR